MSGCYGDHPEDLARERELNRYLDAKYAEPEYEERCTYCGELRGEKQGCCGENHWEMVEVEDEDGYWEDDR